MKLLALENVNFTYDGYKFVLRNINMEFETGKIYGIYGKSGAGKTTLLSLIAGLEKATAGQVLYRGVDLKKMNRDQYRSNDIGVIFQSYNLLTHLTALENVILSMDISKEKFENKEKMALELLKNVGIDEEKARRRVLHLSGGEQQRVSIARALSYRPQIILADEPTGNLDKETEKEILDILVSLAHQDHKCVIIISHSQKVRSITDRCYFLERGKLEVEK